MSNSMVGTAPIELGLPLETLAGCVQIGYCICLISTSFSQPSVVR
nr:MAG TPA: hypothetical protein [Caudoviricetes sp.]